MKKVLFLLQVAWAWWYHFIFVLVFLLFYPAFFVLLRREKWYPAANRLRLWWAYILFPLTGLRYRIEYEAPLDRTQQYIFCANHFSYLDIPISALVARRNWRFMAKMELDNIPLFNIFFRTIDIAVNRGSIREAVRAMDKAKESLDRGMDIVVYPEGTIGPAPPQLLRFKSGPFRLAIEKQVAVVPVTMLSNWKLLYVNGWKMHGRPGLSHVIVHQPLSTRGLTAADTEYLKEKVFHIIQESLNAGTMAKKAAYV